MAKKKTSATDETSAEASLDPAQDGAKDDTAPAAEEAEAEKSGTGETGVTEPAEPASASEEEARNPDDSSDRSTPEEAATDGEPADEHAVDTVEPEPEADTAPEPASTPAPVEKVIVERGGFVPMLLGGAAAAAIGFGASLAILPDGWPRQAEEDPFRQQVEEQLSRNAGTLASVETQLEALASGPDLSPIETELSAISTALDGLGGRLGAAEDTLSDIEARLTAVEKLPVTTGASEAAVAAYERELDALRESMAAQRAEIETMIENAQAVEDDAEEIANAAMRRAAVTRILTALDTGTGFAPALADLEASGAEIPSGLSSVANDGVASLTDLQESFPDAARAALAASREAEAKTGESGGFRSFLRNQLGARSLEPREGNDPDAILSRAEAAIREGRLTDALAEIETLPEVGRTELTDWSARASRRLDALSAAQALSETMN